MKQILSVAILIAALVSLGIGGTFASWVESDSGGYAFRADQWHVDQEGTIGFWRGPGAQDAYGEALIEDWLGAINTNSDWLGPTTYAEMISEDWLNYGGPDMYMKFCAQYLAQRLNQISSRQSPLGLHNVMDVASYAISFNYLNLADPYQAPGWEIIPQIESKFGTSPTAGEFEIMKDVCDALNNLDI